MPEPQTISTEILRSLHRLHRQITDLKALLARGPKQIKATEANVAHRESLLTQAKEADKNFRMSVDHKQLQLKTAEGKVKELRIKLNTAQSNREYQTLLEQIQAAEMANSVLADEILESMEKIDEYKKNVAQTESDLNAAKEKMQKVREEVSQKEPGQRQKLAELEAELKNAEKELPSEVLEPYQRVVRHLGEDALAPVEGQCCGGCNQQIPLNLCSQIMMNKPIFCNTCGRMLYMTLENQPRKLEE